MEKIQRDMTAAMKARDKITLNTLRSVKTALDRYRVDKQKPVDDKAEQEVLNTLAKQRQEAADAFRKGGRDESADKELAEKKILESYMSPATTEEEVLAAIEKALQETAATSVIQAGAVMKYAQSLLSGKRVDNKALMEKIRAKLK